MSIQVLRTTIAAAALAVIGLPALAGPTALSPLANLGWVADNLDVPNTPTDNSPFTFTLLSGKVAVFKVTDSFLPGDSFDLYLNGSLTITLSSSGFAGAPHAVIGDAGAEANWQDAGFEKFAYSFSTPGDYSFEVRGDGFAGTPAGLFFRLDVNDIPDGTVPEPGSLALAGLALAGLGFSARRRKNA